MFTGYVGLEFTTPESGLCRIYKADYKWMFYTRERYLHPLTADSVIDGVELEKILNKQGKAPKRIQYEVYLNAYYSKTDNAIELMRDKYYNLGKAVKECHNPLYETGDRLYYAPSCKLPSNYLPTKLQAGHKLNTLWHCPSSSIIDPDWVEYEVYMTMLAGVGSGKQYLCDDAPQDWLSIFNTYSPSWNLIKIGCGFYPACKLPVGEVVDTTKNNPSLLPQETIDTIDDELFGADGRIGLFEELEPTPLWSESERDYQVITGSQYVKIYELDIAQFPILQPPNAGDDTAYNLVYIRSDNVISFEDGCYVWGNGKRCGVSKHQFYKKSNQCVKAPCCKLPK